jgi:alkaline phosphatase
VHRYANGLGYYVHTNPEGGRKDPTKIDRSANNFRFPTTLPVDSETHGGEDVGIWAVGPWAHLFQGTLEQHVIPHVMAYASCIGDGLTLCKEQSGRSTEF